MTHDYFRPLRRKIGVMTLVVACVFTAGWVRSLAIKDTINFPRDARTIWFVVSNRSRIHLWQLRATFPLIRVQRFHEASPAAKEGYFNEEEYHIERHWQAVGFEFGKTQYCNFSPPFENQLWFIPYWSIVAPLTLMTAWLLLCKPKRQNQTLESPE